MFAKILRSRRKLVFAALLCLVLGALLPQSAPVVRGATPVGAYAEGTYMPGEVIVTFKIPAGDGAMLDAQTFADRKLAMEDRFDLRFKEDVLPGKIVLFKTRSDESVDSLIGRISADKNVQAVQPNFIYHIEAQRIDHGVAAMNAPAAWQNLNLTGAGIVVAVPDSGVDYNHPDLAENIWRNPGDDCSNGRDDDNNGFVDDCRGWDFANGDNDPMDDVGTSHGTLVAGLVAARNNDIGMVGVAPNAKIMPIKVMVTDAGYTSAAMFAGIQYAYVNGARIISISSGTYNSDGVVQYGVEDAENAGVVVVASAGNRGTSRPHSPSGYPTVISAGAVDTYSSVGNNYQRASFSNYGPRLNVMAPGVGITSTIRNGFYSGGNGTSFASPHVAGAGALLLQQNPNLTPAEVRNILSARAVDLGAPGRDDYYGHGFVDAYRLTDPLACIVPATDGRVIGAAPYTVTYSVPAGAYSGTNTIGGVDIPWSASVPAGNNSVSAGAGRYRGSNGSTCTWDFTIAEPGTGGTINILATLNGAPWSGSLNISYTAPGVARSGSHAVVLGSEGLASFSNVAVGAYTIDFAGGGPANATFVGINGLGTRNTAQTLTVNGTIAYVFEFRS